MLNLVPLHPKNGNYGFEGETRDLQSLTQNSLPYLLIDAGFFVPLHLAMNMTPGEFMELQNGLDVTLYNPRTKKKKSFLMPSITKKRWFRDMAKEVRYGANIFHRF